MHRLLTGVKATTLALPHDHDRKSIFGCALLSQPLKPLCLRRFSLSCIAEITASAKKVAVRGVAVRGIVKDYTVFNRSGHG